ncbi:hypothetical protein LXL04_036118 [Taraxacum kok-saghyz]
MLGNLNHKLQVPELGTGTATELAVSELELPQASPVPILNIREQPSAIPVPILIIYETANCWAVPVPTVSNSSEQFQFQFQKSGNWCRQFQFQFQKSGNRQFQFQFQFLKKEAIFNDVMTPRNFDNAYYQNLQRGLGVLKSDRALVMDPRTKPFVELYARDQKVFFEAFGGALEKLSLYGVKTGRRGDILRRCDSFN